MAIPDCVLVEVVETGCGVVDDADVPCDEHPISVAPSAIAASIARGRLVVFDMSLSHFDHRHRVPAARCPQTVVGQLIQGVPDAAAIDPSTSVARARASIYRASDRFWHRPFGTLGTRGHRRYLGLNITDALGRRRKQLFPGTSDAGPDGTDRTSAHRSGFGVR